MTSLPEDHPARSLRLAPSPGEVAGDPDAASGCGLSAAARDLATGDALIDGLPSGIVVIDRDFRIQRANAYMGRWLKRPAEEMLGQRCHELIHARETPCQDCPCATSFRTGEPASAVHDGIDALGGTTHAELVSLPIRDASGQVVLCMESARDVSERVRHVQQLASAVEGLRTSQAELRRRNEELELVNGLLVRAGSAQGLDAVLAALLDVALRAVGGAASAAILLLDGHGRRLELAASRGMEGALGPCPASRQRGECTCARAALDGVVRWTPDCHAACQAGAFSSLSVPLSSGGQVLGALVVHLPAGQALPPGRERLFELLGRQMGVAVENAQLYQRTDAQLHRKVGELTEALASVERERARAQASERAKEEFVSMVAHDLRSPLTVIQADAGELGSSCQEPGCLAARESIRRSVRRASGMLGEVVDSARLEAGALALEHQPVDLAALLRDLVANSIPAGQRERLRLTLPADPATVLGDAAWLERAAANVIGNALKFAPGDDAVAVALEAAGGEVRLSVTDRGPGIPADEVRHLFGRYFRASNARPVGGSGLGLYITRLVVQALGGRAWASSELGRGTTVVLALPAAPDARS